MLETVRTLRRRRQNADVIILKLESLQTGPAAPATSATAADPPPDVFTRPKWKVQHNKPPNHADSSQVIRRILNTLLIGPLVELTQAHLHLLSVRGHAGS